MSLEGKTAVITGGGRGIGKEIAGKFVQKGATVAILDIDEETVTGACRDLGEKAKGYVCDVTSIEQVEETAAKIAKECGPPYVLVNNAGITKDNLLLRMSEAEWDAVLNVNLKGAFVCTKVFSKYMIKARCGRIINISSIIGLMGNAGQANYSASKAGLIGLTKSTAKELASRGITVNAVAPGYIMTAMTEKLPEETREAMLSMIPLKRYGTPADVAGVVLFLAGEDASYITGEVIRVDGGMAM